MIKTQIQIPDWLYREAKRIAAEREMSFAEVVRRGIEQIARVYPALSEQAGDWAPPAPRHLGRFLAPASDWRLMASECEEC